MPCQSEPESYMEITAPLRAQLERAKERVEELTQHLCFICGTLEQAHRLSQYASKPMFQWWEAHQKWDNERVRPKMTKYVEERYKTGFEMKAADVARHFIDEAEKVHPVSAFHKEWFLGMATEILESVRNKREAEKREELAQENLKRSALRKLTRNERKALGLERGR